MDNARYEVNLFIIITRAKICYRIAHIASLWILHSLICTKDEKMLDISLLIVHDGYNDNKKTYKGVYEL